MSFTRISRSSNEEYNQNVTRIFHLNSINMSGVGTLHFMALDVPPWPEVSSNFDKRKHFCVHANFPTDNPQHMTIYIFNASCLKSYVDSAIFFK